MTYVVEYPALGALKRAELKRSIRLPDDAFTSRPWRIHDLAPDFRLEDVWALPTPGGPDDFHHLVHVFGSLDPSGDLSGPARALTALRSKLGDLLGWDRARLGADGREVTLRGRLPDDLRRSPAPAFGSKLFSALFQTNDEFAAEVANRTVHAVIHLCWVPGDRGTYSGQMAVLVKPNGRSGSAYMSAIRPFRHLIVYPALMRQIERSWRSRAGQDLT